jgi:hypothetical protein
MLHSLPVVCEQDKTEGKAWITSTTEHHLTNLRCTDLRYGLVKIKVAELVL